MSTIYKHIPIFFSYSSFFPPFLILGKMTIIYGNFADFLNIVLTKNKYYVKT